MDAPKVYERGAAQREIAAALSAASDECIFWSLSRDAYGYARWGEVLVHRHVCQIVHGAPPSAGHVSAHWCNNGHLGCINPRHLRWATQKENLADRISNGTHLAGESIATAKLTEHGVMEIRRRLAAGELAASIARDFGVVPATISHVKNRKTWAHVP